MRVGHQRLASQASARASRPRWSPTPKSGTEDDGKVGGDGPRPRPRLRALSGPRRHRERPSAHGAAAVFEEMGWPQDVIDAVAGHATFLEVPRETQTGQDALRRGRALGVRRRLRAGAADRHRGHGAEIREEEAQAAFVRGGRQSRRGAPGRRGAGRRLRRARPVRDRRDGRPVQRAWAWDRARLSHEAPLEGPPRIPGRARCPARGQHGDDAEPDEGGRDDRRRLRRSWSSPLATSR